MEIQALQWPSPCGFEEHSLVPDPAAHRGLDPDHQARPPGRPPVPRPTLGRTGAYEVIGVSLEWNQRPLAPPPLVERLGPKPMGPSWTDPAAWRRARDSSLPSGGLPPLSARARYPTAPPLRVRVTLDRLPPPRRIDRVQVGREIPVPYPVPRPAPLPRRPPCLLGRRVRSIPVRIRMKDPLPDRFPPPLPSAPPGPPPSVSPVDERLRPSSA